MGEVNSDEGALEFDLNARRKRRCRRSDFIDEEAEE